MQKILVPVRGDGKGDNVFAHAVGLARRSGAHIQVTHCRSRPEDMIPYGVAVSPVLKEQIIEQSVNLLNKQEQGLCEEILALAQANGAILAKPSDDDTVTVSFIEEEGRQIEVIRHHGLLSDMTAVAQPDLDRNIGTNTFQAALFSTGRPVMMFPEAKSKIPENLGQNIAVAWDGSVESSLAVMQTLSLLKSAEQVTIITNTTDTIKVSPEELSEFLAMHGVQANISIISKTADISRSILDQAAAIGVDMLVLGAYGNSKNLERVAGGVTQDVIDHATLPVVFVN